MPQIPKIKNISALEMIDSRGNPTVCAQVVLDDESGAYALVPSGASTGKYEAFELRDCQSGRFLGRGTKTACENINDKIAEKLIGIPANQFITDQKLLNLDKSENKSNLGANAILAVSMAICRAAAVSLKLPLYRYLGGISATVLPIPMMNILNGGAHASNNADIQEFMIVPLGFDSYSDALRCGCEIYHTLGQLLKADGKSTTVGDEGGYAPDFDSEDEMLDYLVRAINHAGYTTDEVKIALDAASSEWYYENEYILPKSGKKLNAEQLCRKWTELCEKYPIISIEDAAAEDDYESWKMITAALGDKIMLVGDDLFVTNEKRLKKGIDENIANSILIKPNQIGTISETVSVMKLAAKSGYNVIVSHRSGDTEDTFVSDLAVALGASFVKFGAPCRSERTSKYNRLLKIEASLGSSALYGFQI